MQWVKGACPVFYNKPVSEVSNWLSDLYGIYVGNATGIEGSIYMNPDCIEAFNPGVIKALERYGLKLVASRKEMKVLVISDKN